jgi:O-antigen ligase
LSREAAWRLEGKEWMAAVPLVGLASLEAGLGLAQFFSNWPNGVAHGTFVNRNHFAGFLELGLLMAVGVAAAGRGPSERRVTLRRGLGIVAGALILAGIIHSLSRMGFVAALAGLAVFGGAVVSRKFQPRGIYLTKRKSHAKWIVVAALPVLVAVLFLYLPPDQLVARFAELAATEEINADMRLQIWRETLGLIRAYALPGCGLGGYEAAFLRYKTVAPLNTVDYAHNDYLQGMAELGVVGFGLWLAAAVWVLRLSWRRPAAAGALAALALHSVVDFNLYIPANAMAVAWVAGLGTTE